MYSRNSENMSVRYPDIMNAIEKVSGNRNTIEIKKKVYMYSIVGQTNNRDIHIGL